jgi:hypothetical protein
MEYAALISFLVLVATWIALPSTSAPVAHKAPAVGSARLRAGQTV